MNKGFSRCFVDVLYFYNFQKSDIHAIVTAIRAIVKTLSEAEKSVITACNNAFLSFMR
jgi:hypothetical protein